MLLTVDLISFRWNN